ncbi:alanine--tRNA ligase, cytoplasmic-like isoform X4 [Symsagittifera roscoffensis]|uniref:alanine--tRNA ligase, cytoplasmic-like isoform X4 n=1 Tax=Symsagittifera roscoffensis TaxID=84072 RepID=UPI00307B9B58
MISIMQIWTENEPVWTQKLLFEQLESQFFSKLYGCYQSSHPTAHHETLTSVWREHLKFSIEESKYMLAQLSRATQKQPVLNEHKATEPITSNMVRKSESSVANKVTAVADSSAFCQAEERCWRHNCGFSHIKYVLAEQAFYAHLAESAKNVRKNTKFCSLQKIGKTEQNQKEAKSKVSFSEESTDVSLFSEDSSVWSKRPFFESSESLFWAKSSVRKESNWVEKPANKIFNEQLLSTRVPVDMLPAYYKAEEAYFCHRYSTNSLKVANAECEFYKHVVQSESVSTKASTSKPDQALNNAKSQPIAKSKEEAFMDPEVLLNLKSSNDIWIPYGDSVWLKKPAFHNAETRFWHNSNIEKNNTESKNPSSKRSDSKQNSSKSESQRSAVSSNVAASSLGSSKATPGKSKQVKDILDNCLDSDVLRASSLIREELMRARAIIQEALSEEGLTNLKEAVTRVDHIEADQTDLKDVTKRIQNQLQSLEDRVKGLEAVVKMKNGERPTTSSEVRQCFIDYFVAKHAHRFCPSSSTIPHEDPTLLFANAGMNQFKPLFLGTADPNSDLGKLKRACNTQKCIRAGGKHNDLDDVGKDTYHHTFFEMLGNWSFGDYFKKEACFWALDLLTNYYKINKSRLYFTYFGGNKELGLEPDEECRQIWLDLGIPASCVLPFDMKDNFWEMGDTGPCGPCSEIHYDRVGGRDAASLVNMDDPEVVEIWNLVFIQFNREVGGDLKPLPKKHVDTGMGFERVVSVIQDKMSNYDTDVFTPIFNAIQEKANVRAYTGKLGLDDTDSIDMAYRVLADHARTLTVAISDGGRPDNTGRGYVLRRILRRAVRFSTEVLKAKPGFFADLVDTIVECIGPVFPEVRSSVDTVKKIINEEEQQFLKTLVHGQKVFQKTISQLDSNILPGHLVWRLYETYGFPVDLTTLMAEEKGLQIDQEGFEKAKEHSIIVSRGEGKVVGETITLDVHAISELESKSVAKTDDSHKYQYSSNLEGIYDFSSCDGTVLGIIKNKEFCTSVSTGDECGILLDKTNFYAESGGQIYDQGIIHVEGSGASFHVTNVQVHGGYVLHVGQVESGTFAVGDKVGTLIDEERRRPTMNNHTTTHLVNFALRNVLSEDADQRGSLVAPEYLRFDFTAKGAMTDEQVAKVEEIVNKLIANKLPVFAQVVPLSKGKAIQGLRAIFGETYPDPVRVLSVGANVDDLVSSNGEVDAFQNSVEFCGGTHVQNIGHIEQFALISEEAISKGIRRIVGVTGNRAKEAMITGETLLARLKDVNSRMPEGECADLLRIKQLDSEFVSLKQDIDTLTISQSVKRKIAKDVVNGRKKLAELERKSTQQAQANLTETVKELLASSNKSFLIHKTPESTDDKTMNKVAQTSDKPIVMLSNQPEKKIIKCLISVPKAFHVKITADTWMDSLSKGGISCKGGGKGANAQAQIAVKPEEVESTMAQIESILDSCASSLL